MSPGKHPVALAKITAASRRTDKLIDLVGTIVTTLVPWGGAVAIVFFGIYMPVTLLAGKFTWTDIRIAGEFKLSAVIPWVVTAGAIAYGVQRERLRRNTVKHLGEPRQQAEQAIDPGRSSSKLMPRGTTRPEDKK